MALQSPTVTSGTVTMPQSGLYVVPINLTVVDDEAGFDGINYNTSVDFPEGANINDYVASVTAELQEVIDEYKQAKTAQQSAALANAISNIEGGLVV